MQLDSLIAILEELREAYGGASEVRLMTQPNYPFENSVVGVVTSENMREAASGEEDCEDEEREPEDVVVYLLEGEQLGYGSKLAWNLL